MAMLSGQGNKLFVELRDKMSLAYAISSFSFEGIEPGYIAIYMAVDPKRVNEAIEKYRRFSRYSHENGNSCFLYERSK